MSAVIQAPRLQFRPMQESDLAQVLDTEVQAYQFPWSSNIFQDCLRIGYCSWVLEQEQFIIAYGVMSIAVGECHILNLCVHPQFQGLGYGQMMLEHLLELARKHKADMAFLEVRPSNGVARHLYDVNGFDEVGMRRNYYPAHVGREDAVIMACSLLP